MTFKKYEKFVLISVNKANAAYDLCTFGLLRWFGKVDGKTYVH